MNSDVMKYESTLRLQEDELAEIENQQKALVDDIILKQMQLQKLVAKKARRLRLHVLTKDELGLPLTDEERKLLPPEFVRSNSVPPEAFKGMTLVEAAEAYLIWRGEPATHREVVDGVRAGGLETQLKNLENSMRSALQRCDKFKWFEDAEGTCRWALLQSIDRPPREAAAHDPGERPNLTLVAPESITKSA